MEGYPAEAGPAVKRYSDEDQLPPMGQPSYRLYQRATRYDAY